MGGGLIAEAKPIQILLCHTNEDKAAVLEIYHRLKTLGYTRRWPLWSKQVGGMSLTIDDLSQSSCY
jgi:hypothetical protein